MDIKSRCISAAVLLFASISASAQVVINEVMQSNVYCIMDDINEFPDSWVELYNGGSNPVDIQGYRLGLTDNVDDAYLIEDPTTIAAGGYLVIYCDKEATGLHTSFRVDSGKGSVVLFDAEGNVIDQVTMKKQPAPDIPYARTGDADTWGHATKGTPGARNDVPFSETLLGDVIFSQPGAVFKSAPGRDLELYFPDDAPDDATIIYTTDGSEPVSGKAKTYTKPMKINGSMVVRAKVVRDGYLSAPSTAQSYLVLDRDQQVPVISILGNNEYFYDTKIGIFADGTGGKDNENYRYNWRRPINIEYFPVGGNSAINQLCETRVQGGYTRCNPLKSMALYANKRFGTKRFDYELWEKDKPGITDIKSFVLRNGGNDYIWCYVRDGLMQRVIGRNTEIDWQGYAPAVVFLNGKYHAMLAIRERSNEDNIYSNYEGLEDIHMVENWEELKTGDWSVFEALTDFVQSEHSYEEWCAMIDIDSYINLMALNFWVYNTDFPHNNIVVWRPAQGDDTRWRFLVKDCDFGLGIWNSNDNLYKNFHDFLMAGEGPGYDIYRNLMKCPEFFTRFRDHMIAYHGDFLNGATFKNYLDEIMDENHGEQLISHDIWKMKDWSWWSDLNNNISFMRTWIDKRQNTMSNLMIRTFGLRSAVKVSVNNEVDASRAANLHLTYAETPLTAGKFDGNDYLGRRILIDSAPEDNIVAWNVSVGGGETVRYDGASLDMEIASVSPVYINAVIDESGITDAVDDSVRGFVYADGIVSPDVPVTVYDAAGRVVGSGIAEIVLPAKGVYVVVTADGAATKVCVR